jgi:hypothetical protein
MGLIFIIDLSVVYQSISADIGQNSNQKGVAFIRKQFFLGTT